MAEASARAVRLELDAQREVSARRRARYLVAILVVAGIMLIGVVVTRVRSPGERTSTAPPAPRPAVTTVRPPQSPAPSPPPPAPALSAPPPPATPGSESAPAPVVAPGDSLWSIAATQVSERLGRSASDAEVTPYWCALVRANADNLPRPGNPDLVYPGQQLELPSV